MLLADREKDDLGGGIYGAEFGGSFNAVELFHQDVQKKAHMALKRLMKLIQGEELKELNIKSSVYLVKRDSVRE